MAKQADGAALVRYGETVVLVTAVAARDLKLDTDFFPLTVDYLEKTFAAGKIPGGFFKREGRPSEKEILTCRLIDRSIRPLFSEGLRCETQVIATVLSADRENDPDVVAMLGTSIALHVSDIPFNGPLAGVLAWAVRGCLEWQLVGLDPPPAVLAATTAYRTEMDRLGEFLEACCILDEHAQVPKGVLYARYVSWAQGEGEKPLSSKGFGMRLQERGFDDTRTSAVRSWLGLEVAPP